MDGWNITFLLGRPIFRGYVSFRECTGKHFQLGLAKRLYIFSRTATQQPELFHVRSPHCAKYSTCKEGAMLGTYLNPGIACLLEGLAIALDKQLMMLLTNISLRCKTEKE